MGIDVIAPADILKQIFKMPYSKAQLSIAVRRIGQTLVLNSGPDVDEEEKLVRRHNGRAKCGDQSLFLNFAMHSVRMEACDCPPSHHSPEMESNSSVLPGGSASQFVGSNDNVVPNEGVSHHSDYPEVTPLTWLEAWLGNIMASVPELAICYHENGVAQGYELVKADEIFLLKGISEDGAPAFHPHVVQQNGLSVLRFLQENCTQDPGAYWLYKSAGEDMIQLLNLSAILDSHSSGDCNDDSSCLLPLHRGRTNFSFSLGTLLYRIAHQLSLSMAPDRRAKCASFFRKCLEFLDEPDDLVVRASAHGEFARLLLTNVDELELSSESLVTDYEATVPVLSQDPFHCSPEYAVDEDISEPAAKDIGSVDENASLEATDRLLEVNEPVDALPTVENDETLAVCEIPKPLTGVVQTVSDPISSKLAAIHHVSQAIKALRWVRQLQPSEAEFIDESSIAYDQAAPGEFSACACGDPDCIEVCDIREWLPTSKIDHKLW